MPIYGFTCDTCGKEFQTLVRTSDTAECPSCGSTALTRQLSLIAQPSKGGDPSAGSFAAPAGGHACASPMCCGGGGCG
jgi:putative FmdB family regulatory protein